MIFALLAHLFSVLLDLLSLLVRSDREKDLPDRTPPSADTPIAADPSPPTAPFQVRKVAAGSTGRKTHPRDEQRPVRLSHSLLLVTPEAVLRWHRELVRRTWTIPHRRVAGRSRLAPDLEARIVR